MNTFPSGEPLSGWHWICPCGFSLHCYKDETDPMLKEVREHRTWHQKQIQRLTRPVDVN